MPIPASGPISMSMFNTELGRSATTPNSQLAGGNPPTAGSLFFLANQSGILNQVAPFEFGEWYGYTANNIVRVFYESPYTASRSTTTATTAINVSTIGSVNSDAKGLAIFYMATTDLNSVTADVNFNLISGSTTVIGLNIEPQDTTDTFSMGGGYFDLLETNGRFTASFSQETAGNTAGYAGYTLVGLQLTGSESGSHSAGATVYRSTTYTTKTSVPVPAGDYIVVGSSAVLTQDAGVVARVRMFDGTNQYGEMFDIYEQDISNWTPYWHVFRTTTTGTTTFSLQARSDGVNDIEVRQASVIVLDTSKFANVYYAQNTGSFSTDSSTYVNAMTGSFTIVNPSNKHLLLAAAMLSGSRAAISSFNCKLRNTTTGVDYIPEQVREPNAVNELYPTVVCRTITFSGASNTIAWQLLEEVNSTAHLSNMTIAILDLGTTGIPTTTTTTTTTSTTTTTTTAAPTTTTSTTTTTTTNANNLQAISVRLDTVITLCSTSPVIRYVEGGVLSGQAKILYLANLTTPVTGFNYVVASSGGPIYEIGFEDGSIGNDTGDAC